MTQISNRGINNFKNDNFVLNNFRNYNYSEIDFLQNLSAARESSLLSKFNRIKSSIEKIQEKLINFEGNEEEQNKIQQNLDYEKNRYQKLLAQINSIRTSNIKEELNDSFENIIDNTSISQTIAYYSDSDFYINVLENNSINIAKSKYLSKKLNKSKFDESKININNNYNNEYLLF